MRVLVYPHAMEVGGSQLNALELAGAVRDRGHDVLVVSEDGPLLATVESLGLERIPLAGGPRRRRPSGAVARQLVSLVREREIDVVHGYEWPPGVEAWFGPRLRAGAAAVCTVMSMSVAPFLPRSMPLVVGTAAIRDRARADGFGSVTLIEPPVDTEANHPGFTPGDFGAGPLVVVVCRLAPVLKREGLLAAVDAVGALNAAGFPCRLAVVGDGPCRDELASRAAAVNTAAGAEAVHLYGELADPRPAYAAADVVLGMGGSALRGMAFGKPLVVQGEGGFWELLTPESAPAFLADGWYGVGGGDDGAPRLAGILRRLLADAGERDRLGKYARELVVDRFGLRAAATTQERVYHDALVRPGARADSVRAGAATGAYVLKRRLARARGTARSDDFNAVTGEKK